MDWSTLTHLPAVGWPTAIALAIALITVSYQTLKAALADPVRSLRHE